MTTEMMGWLNQNRYRSYPMARDEWREKVSPDSGLDRVLLDALVFDADAVSGVAGSALVFSRLSVSLEGARAFFTYRDKEVDVDIPSGETSGENSFRRVHVVVAGNGRNATMSFVFSSYEHIAEFVGLGDFDIGCSVLPSRVLGLSDGYGVDCISTNGSSGVSGHDVPAEASGDVVLEDGYRTSPIISGGKVHVRVGRRYGHDPCEHDYGEEGARDCKKPLFFFCGQNAVNSGNIVIKGGVGISVRQGGKYAVRDGTCAGRSIPAIEIVASSKLLDMYEPIAR